MSETSDLDNFSSASPPNLNILNPGDEMNHCLSCLDKDYYCYKISRQATKFQELRRNEIFYSFYLCNPGLWKMVCLFRYHMRGLKPDEDPFESDEVPGQEPSTTFSFHIGSWPDCPATLLNKNFLTVRTPDQRMDNFYNH